MDPIERASQKGGDNVGSPGKSTVGTAAAIVVMGPSGSGKTTLGERLARTLGRPFVDADDHHSPSNIEKMKAGTSLTDEDRRPWLEGLRDILSKEPSTVLACSALKRSYRTLLRPTAIEVVFLLLDVPESELARRLKERSGHYAGPSLLASQLATLEPPDDELRSYVVDGSGPEEEVLKRARAALALEASSK